MHRPVMLDEVINQLALRPGMTVIDGTVGGGGHAIAMIKAIQPKGRFLGLDTDAASLARVKPQLTIYPNVQLVHANFAELESVATEVGVNAVDAVLLDLGFSSIQLDDPARGFSFQADGPLDMRLDQSSQLTAHEIINRWSEKALADALYRYGELYDARRIARQIVANRQKGPIETTQDLIKTVGLTNPGVKAKLFQALRITVNSELQSLEKAIPQIVSLLKPEGRVAIITFHSLEDRIVKQQFRDNHLLEPLTKKPILPSEQEITDNPRSRSAKLRVAQKIPVNQ